MESFRFHYGRALIFVLLQASLFIALAAPAFAWGDRLVDAPPVWYDRDDADLPEAPEERDPNLVWNDVSEDVVRPLDRFFYPAYLLGRVTSIWGGEIYPEAANFNALGEVPNSTWFTNRIGLFPMSVEEAARGPGSGEGPDRSEPWLIVSAKTEGVTPGFNIKDARGDVYLIKFDFPEYPGMSTASGVISGRIIHAAGYNVPEDAVVNFRREDIVLGEGVKMKLPSGERKIMTEEDLEALLNGVQRNPDGSWRALSSKFLSGKPIGPFDYRGRRKDDPNDRINHQNRRELRGFRLFAAWLNHFDTKQHNSLDMYVEEGGRHFVRHYLIDFASTLGAGAKGTVPRYGFEYTIAFLPVVERTITLGLKEDSWRRLTRDEELKEIGYFESYYFEPLEFKPLLPNSAFAKMTARDAYWAAKIISAFTDEQLEAIVATGKYQNPEATEYMTRMLIERRDKIARQMFDRIPPIDFFTYEGGILRFRDLGEERGLYPESGPKYRVKVAAVDAGRNSGRRTKWLEIGVHEVNLESGQIGEGLAEISKTDFPFFEVHCQLNRGNGWSGSVTAYVSRKSGRVVAVER